MKTLVFVFQICALSVFGQLPQIGSFTVIPANPINSQSITIVSQVTTPSQGVLVDKSYSISTNPNIIHLHLCYGYGMLPATHSYVDTFSIGTLPVGSYSIILKAFMSSANQHCNKIDSNMSTFAFQVKTTTALKQREEDHEIEVYPNPVSQRLIVQCECSHLKVSVFKMDGQLIKQVWVQSNETVPFEDLPVGIYFVRIDTDKSHRIYKIVKEG